MKIKRRLKEKEDLRALLDSLEYNYYILSIVKKYPELDYVNGCDWLPCPDDGAVIEKMCGFLPLTCLPIEEEDIECDVGVIFLEGKGVRIILRLFKYVIDYCANILEPVFFYGGRKITDYYKGECSAESVCVLDVCPVVLYASSFYFWRLSVEDNTKVLKGKKREILDALACDFSDYNAFWDVVELAEAGRLPEAEDLGGYSFNDVVIIETIRSIYI